MTNQALLITTVSSIFQKIICVHFQLVLYKFKIVLQFSLTKHDKEQAEQDVLSQEFLMHEDTSSEEGTDNEQSLSNKETINNSEYTDDTAGTSRQEQNVTESLRQRTNRQSYVVRMQPSFTHYLQPERIQDFSYEGLHQ